MMRSNIVFIGIYWRGEKNIDNIRRNRDPPLSTTNNCKLQRLNKHVGDDKEEIVDVDYDDGNYTNDNTMNQGCD